MEERKFLVTDKAIVWLVQSFRGRVNAILAAGLSPADWNREMEQLCFEFTRMGFEIDFNGSTPEWISLEGWGCSKV